MSPISGGLYLGARIPAGGRIGPGRGIQLIPDTIDRIYHGGEQEGEASWIQRLRCILTLTLAAGRYGCRVLQRGVGIIILSINSEKTRNPNGGARIPLRDNYAIFRR